MKTKRIRITFYEEILGTASGDPEVHDNYIASKAPDAKSRKEEIAAIGVEEEIEKSKTVFPKEDGKPFIFDYQLKGFFKDAQKALNRIVTWTDDKGNKTNLKLTAYKDKIDGLVFPRQRKIFYNVSEEPDIGDCQRPLRAETAQGPRVALANSESLPVGTWIEFTLDCLDNETMAYMVHCLNYGVKRGIGQWRNSGKGRFLWEELDKDGNVIGGNKAEWEAKWAAEEAKTA